MENINWPKEFGIGITITDLEGKIVYMNDKSLEIFKNDGGEKLLGANVLNCHPEPSRTQLEEMMKNETTNAYTIEKNGKKKLIYQAPWYEDKVYRGFVELSMEIPFDMANFIRK
jgi:transcriptional regulator with PAS, ATPase and Fis domain